MKPIEIVFLSLWNLSNYLNNYINPFLPKLFLTPALNANVGWNFDKYLTHLAVTDVGIKSVLFKIYTICLN